MNQEKIAKEGRALSIRIDDDISETMKKLKLEEDEARYFRDFTLATVICAHIQARCYVLNENLDDAIGNFIKLIHEVLELGKNLNV
jgi:hypothetical protein